MGHVDYYVNDGAHQPGCNDDSPNFSGIAQLPRGGISPDVIYPGCSHKRAFKYYIEASAQEDCDFIGLQCPSFKDFYQVCFVTRHR